MSRVITVLTCVLLFAVRSAAAQTNSEIQSTVKSGMRVAIVDDEGREIEGRVDTVSDRSLLVRAKKDRKEIPFDSIVRIERPDGVANGALTGLFVGVALGLIGGFADGQGTSRQPTFALISALGNGVICTGLGTAIDAMFNHRRTLYQRGGEPQTRVTPIVGRHAAGAALSLTW
jgi:hypothetical protein